LCLHRGALMQFDIDGMAPIDRYELLLGTIVPRPIALITSLGQTVQSMLPHTAFSMSWVTTRLSQWFPCWRILKLV
jgi:hypothetical protein